MHYAHSTYTPLTDTRSRPIASFVVTTRVSRNFRAARAITYDIIRQSSYANTKHATKLKNNVWAARAERIIIIKKNKKTNTANPEYLHNSLRPYTYRRARHSSEIIGFTLNRFLYIFFLHHHFFSFGNFASARRSLFLFFNDIRPTLIAPILFYTYTYIHRLLRFSLIKY